MSYPCPPCCGRPQCTNCLGNTPSTIRVTFANVSNDTCTVAECSNYWNAAFILDHGPLLDTLSIPRWTAGAPSVAPCSYNYFEDPWSVTCADWGPGNPCGAGQLGIGIELRWELIGSNYWLKVDVSEAPCLDVTPNSVARFAEDLGTEKDDCDPGSPISVTRIASGAPGFFFCDWSAATCSVDSVP